MQLITDTSHSSGITIIRNRLRVLGFPSDTPENQAWVYGLGAPFQISSTEGGVFVNIGRKDLLSQGKGDLEIGSNLIIFDDIEGIGKKTPIPINRAEEIKHPQTGERILMASYPVSGGFVPHGAKHKDGSSHPYAGTGFGFHLEVA